MLFAEKLPSPKFGLRFLTLRKEKLENELPTVSCSQTLTACCKFYPLVSLAPQSCLFKWTLSNRVHKLFNSRIKSSKSYSVMSSSYPLDIPAPNDTTEADFCIGNFNFTSHALSSFNLVPLPRICHVRLWLQWSFLDKCALSFRSINVQVWRWCVLILETLLYISSNHNNIHLASLIENTSETDHTKFIYLLYDII